jgi:hemerythrin superfamily protein
MPKNAVALLKEDHKKVKKLLEDLAASTDRAATRRVKLVTEIAGELTVHAQVEEEIFYPAFKKAVKSKEDLKLFHEAAEEHNHMKLALTKVEQADASSVEFGAFAKVLMDLVLHHAKEEEHEMFPSAKEHMSEEELQTLGDLMAARKEALQARVVGK